MKAECEETTEWRVRAIVPSQEGNGGRAGEERVSMGDPGA